MLETMEHIVVVSGQAIQPRLLSALYATDVSAQPPFSELLEKSSEAEEITRSYIISG